MGRLRGFCIGSEFGARLCDCCGVGGVRRSRVGGGLKGHARLVFAFELGESFPEPDEQLGEALLVHERVRALLEEPESLVIGRLGRRGKERLCRLPRDPADRRDVVAPAPDEVERGRVVRLELIGLVRVLADLERVSDLLCRSDKSAERAEQNGLPLVARPVIGIEPERHVDDIEPIADVALGFGLVAGVLRVERVAHAGQAPAELNVFLRVALAGIKLGLGHNANLGLEEGIKASIVAGIVERVQVRVFELAFRCGHAD
eukprot:Amastigsp_a180301_55.p1 type:complete len:260 gc:universal Amastigsp_a180301_55:37-816(+)